MKYVLYVFNLLQLIDVSSISQWVRNTDVIAFQYNIDANKSKCFWKQFLTVMNYWG